MQVGARPEPLTLVPARAALIVVDMQNDFGAKGGMFDRAGIPIDGIRAVVAPTARAIALARGARIQVIYLKMAFRPDLSDAGGPDAPNLLVHRRLKVGEPVVSPQGREGRILIDDTWNTEIITTLLLAGCTTSVCVESTLRDAFFRDYRCLLLEDCVAEPIGSDLSRGNHDASILTAETLFGWVATTVALDAALREPAPPGE